MPHNLGDRRVRGYRRNIKSVPNAKDSPGSFIITKSAAALLGVSLAGFLLSFFWQSPFSYAPSSTNIALAASTAFLLRIIKNRLARFVAATWLIWYIVGSAAVVAASQVSSNVPVESISEAGNFFLISNILLICGITAGERCMLQLSRVELPQVHQKSPHPILIWFLLSTPLLFIFSVYAGTGDLPLLSGRALSEAMYEADYGFFYGYVIYLQILVLVLLLPILSHRMERIVPTVLALMLIIITIMISIIDGRRSAAVASFYAMALAYLYYAKSYRQVLTAFLIIVLGVFLYLVVIKIRSIGYISDLFVSWYDPLLVVGVEYRDFVYAFSHIAPQELRSYGYDWLRSTAASMTPSPITALAGIDKGAMVEMDSARSLMRYFNITLGIRVGVVGELWLAYGWAGQIVVVMLGFAISVVARLATRARTLIGEAILIVILSLLGLSIVGQSTVTFGALPPLIYLAILAWLIDFKTNKKTYRRKPRELGTPRS